MSCTLRRAAILTLSLACFSWAWSAPVLAASAKSMATLRVMLNPASVPRGVLSEATRTRLEALAGVPLRVHSVTRTGALDLAVGGPRDAASLAAAASRLRADRAVLWADVGTLELARPKSTIAATAAHAPARKLLVRFAEGADRAAALARLAQVAGAPLAIERTLGAVQVVGLAQSKSMTDLETLARRFEADAAVRYADPVRRVVPHRMPSDPLFAQQWSLASVNAAAAWDVGTGSGGVTVAVVDTGHVEHPDLAGRVLPGYDFIGDAERARDGDARDADPHDEGDWTTEGDCGGGPAYPSFFHGLFVAGQIAANANNEVGIAGLDWAAKILPVRVLGQCGGTNEDVIAGVLWAAGLEVPGAPPNPNPAKVINLSLGGIGTCSAAEQDAIDEVLAQGTFVVASAGNESDDASNYSPGSCGGVITVGALSRGGERSSYSNYGRRVDISAPGGDVDADGLILSTHAEGDKTPGEASYTSAMGTSFSAPLVSGTLSLMIARNPNLTPGQALTILQGSSSEFVIGSPCVSGIFCGAGALNTGLAIASTFPAVSAVPDGAVAIVEYYDPALDHYLVTADPAEMAVLDDDPGARYRRTGHVFYGWADPGLAPTGVDVRGACRFHAGPEHRIDSHFFTADPAECSFIANSLASVWTLQSTAAFWIEVPTPGGGCREGTLPVYRFFNGRRDANQRLTIDLSVRRAMLNRAWVADGGGLNGAAMCSLI